ncbi:hypothetical protein MUN84_15495 [Hymenobacter sp. 5516J-16]|uniref:Lipoprotein n=1 Tax=Hymenobacter sublimis TaxID=2933777 RepID=A0ABY4JA34_9BACT|nr:MULTISPECIES: hypothetical protein [Hymenobacter]UOQ76013.1 hypothetical protein MUN84_15495 [Hymenobacter sp. 5516J-16]UPL49678.1 hypothetical protein MWH26_01915 [Hymenobacter sublimis]
MKKSLLLLSAAAAFSFASCSENKTADTTATDTTTTTSSTTTPSMATAYSEEAIQRRADRIAADMAAKMKFDDATRTKIRTVYLTRGQRIAELQSKYATDTAGMSAAMRDVYNNSDMEMKTVLTDPTQYSAYESSRVEYMDDRYMEDDTNMATSDMSSSDMSTSNSTSMESGSGSVGTDGKVKVKRDGDIKIKDSQGNKAKIDADDATMKAKPVDGEKIKVE